MEKRCAQSKVLHRLMVEQNIIQDRQEILAEVKRYYQKLYTTSGVGDTSYLVKIVMPQLKEVEKERLDQPISVNEISLALKALANGKSPGTDGLTPDFYKMFWGKLKHILYEVFVESIEQGGVTPNNQVWHFIIARKSW